MRRVHLSIAGAVLLFVPASANCSDDASLPQVTEARQTAFEAEEVRSLSREPNTMSDKLFVLREYRPALREVALAELVMDRVRDPDISTLAVTVRDGHRLGIERLRSIAADLGLPLPADISEIEKAEIEALRSLPPQELALFFLVRQRAMHAWDVTVFTDYERLARNDRLRQYIAETIPPLRRHAAEVDALARVKGIPSKVVTAAPR